MEQTNLGQLPALRLKKTVLVLTIIALVLLLPMVAINLLFEYEQIYSSGEDMMYQAVVAAPNALQVFYAVISLVVPVLLLLALVLRPGKPGITVLVSLAFVCLAVYNAVSFVATLTQNAGEVAMAVMLAIIYVIPAVLYVLAAVSALKGLSVKVLIYVPTLMVMILNLMTLSVNSLTLYPRHFSCGLGLMATASILSCLEITVINLALLLFSAANRIRTILPASIQQETAAVLRLPPDRALQRLNEDLQLGYLKEEDYVRLRAIVLERR